MKHFDDSTKKLIKNVASLITSALVLIAATVAWFSTGGNAWSHTTRGSLQNNAYSVTYYRIHPPVNTLLESAHTGTGSVASFTYCSSGAAQITQPTLSDRMTATWDTTNTGGAGAWSIETLSPGVYDAFRIDVSGTLPKLIINDISCKGLNDTGDENSLTADQKESVYKSVYLYAVAVKTVRTTTVDPETEEESTSISYEALTDADSNPYIVCDSLYNLLDGKNAEGWSVNDTQKLVTLDNIAGTQIDIEKTTTILLFIGVPGASVTSGSGNAESTDYLHNEHDALRQIGAKLSFGSVKVAAH